MSDSHTPDSHSSDRHASDNQATGGHAAISEPPAPGGFYAALTRGALPRLLLLGFLILLLTIPLEMVRFVLDDRTGRQWEVENLIAEQWGGRQTVGGPVIRVPYITYVTSRIDGGTVRQEQRHLLEFLPDRLTADSGIAVEERGKGPYMIPVYGAEFALRATFAPPDLEALGLEDARLLWKEAVISVAIADPSALRGATIRADGTSVEVEPGFAPGMTNATGFHASLLTGDDTAFGERRDVFVSLAFNGMVDIGVLPLAGATEIHLKGNWPHPNFVGSFLPVERTIDDTGFDATWTIASLARATPDAIRNGSIVLDAMQQQIDRIGVVLETPVDIYAQVDRVLKYGILVVGLTFTAIFVVGVLRDLRAHSVQYLLVGGSITLFYLMLLALAERVPFATAYAVAAILDLAAVSLYVGRTVSRAAGVTVALLLALVRGFMFLLLQEEDLSLLIGSLGLFAALAAVMYATRNVDWYRLGTVSRNSAGRSAGGAPVRA